MSRHDLDPVSLLAGSVFLALALVGLLASTGYSDALRWLAPLMLIGIGGTGIAVASRPRP